MAPNYSTTIFTSFFRICNILIDHKFTSIKENSNIVFFLIMHLGGIQIIQVMLSSEEHSLLLKYCMDLRKEIHI